MPREGRRSGIGAGASGVSPRNSNVRTASVHGPAAPPIEYWSVIVLGPLPPPKLQLMLCTVPVLQVSPPLGVCRVTQRGMAASFIVKGAAQMAEAFLGAAAVLGRDDLRAFALLTLERLWAEAWREDEGMAHRPGAGAGAPLLDDQVQAASAAIAAYEHTGEERWLRRALDLAALVVLRFRDPQLGGYFDVAAGTGTGLLGQPAKPMR